MAKLNYIQRSRVRRAINERSMKVSKAYLEALDREVLILVEKHVRIARQDGRVTVMVVDIDLPAKIASLSRSIR